MSQQPPVTPRHREWLRGLLDVCVLAVLAQGDRHGYGIARELERAGVGTVKGGTLYPLLARLEADGSVTSVVNTSLGLHGSCRHVYGGVMSSQRLNISLDGAHAAKLASLAARVHVNEGTLARSLLSTAIDDLDPDPANVASLLDGIDGAFERAQLGVEQAAEGDTIALDEL
jgi:hypothetical protein